MNSFLYSPTYIQQLNQVIIRDFPHLCPVQKDFNLTLNGISRLVMLDRYSQKDKAKKSCQIGDLVLTIIKPDAKFPSKGVGKIVDKFIDQNGIFF